MKALSFLTPFVAHAATISAAIPGTNANTTSSSPGAFIANFYQFALIIGGILAFGVIVYGGIKYMTSAGNPSAASDAKEWIEAALLGLLLLAGGYFILSVVNPQLLNLNLPSLTAATVATPPTAVTGSTTASCDAANPNGVCPSGSKCTTTYGFAAGTRCQSTSPTAAPSNIYTCDAAHPQGTCPGAQKCTTTYGRAAGTSCQ